MHRAYPRSVSLLLVGLVLTGCLEQLSTTRLPEGAARNFFYYVMRNEQAAANAYWAPGHAPVNAAAQVQAAAAALRSYDVEMGKSDVTRDTSGTVQVTLHGRVRAKGTALWRDQVILQATLLEIGPGWRIMAFRLFTMPEPGSDPRTLTVASAPSRS